MYKIIFLKKKLALNYLKYENWNTTIDFGSLPTSFCCCSWFYVMLWLYYILKLYVGFHLNKFVSPIIRPYPCSQITSVWPVLFGLTYNLSPSSDKVSHKYYQKIGQSGQAFYWNKKGHSLVVWESIPTLLLYKLRDVALL